MFHSFKYLSHRYPKHITQFLQGGIQMAHGLILHYQQLNSIML